MARTVEVHCPSCGVLIRTVKGTAVCCPDCNHPQAIILPYEAPYGSQINKASDWPADFYFNPEEEC